MLESDTLCTQRKLKYEWVLHSEHWQELVIIHVPQLNVAPIEDNYANLLIEKSKIHIFSIVITRDHTRKDQNRSSFIKLDQHWNFFLFLLIETHSLELCAISLSYLFKIFVNNSAKKH